MAPASTFISVLLPAPFSPQIECTSPAGATSDTSRNARTPPKFLVMCRISSRGEGPSAAAGGAADPSMGLVP